MEIVAFTIIAAGFIFVCSKRNHHQNYLRYIQNLHRMIHCHCPYNYFYCYFALLCLHHYLIRILLSAVLLGVSFFFFSTMVTGFLLIRFPLLALLLFVTCDPAKETFSIEFCPLLPPLLPLSLLLLLFLTGFVHSWLLYMSSRETSFGLFLIIIFVTYFLHK